MAGSSTEPYVMTALYTHLTDLTGCSSTRETEVLFFFRPSAVISRYRGNEPKNGAWYEICASLGESNTNRCGHVKCGAEDMSRDVG